MLNISPFTFGMTVVQIFDSGNAFGPDVLDIDEKVLVERFLSGIKTVLTRHTQTRQRANTPTHTRAIASTCERTHLRQHANV